MDHSEKLGILPRQSSPEEADIMSRESRLSVGLMRAERRIET